MNTTYKQIGMDASYLELLMDLIANSGGDHNSVEIMFSAKSASFRVALEGPYNDGGFRSTGEWFNEWSEVVEHLEDEARRAVLHMIPQFDHFQSWEWNLAREDDIYEALGIRRRNPETYR